MQTTAIVPFRTQADRRADAGPRRGRCRCDRRGRLERHLDRHGAVALRRHDAVVSGAWAHPLVPGYEAVGRVVRASGDLAVGDRRVRAWCQLLRGRAGAVRRLRLAALPCPSRKAAADPGRRWGESATLLALAATARHTFSGAHDAAIPELIVGHGVLGRLLARLVDRDGRPGRRPIWEARPRRACGGAAGLLASSIPTTIQAPRLWFDHRRQRRSGDPGHARPAALAPGGEIVLAGLLQGSPLLRLPPGLHARGALSASPRNGSATTSNSVGRLASATVVCVLDDLVTHRADDRATHPRPTRPPSGDASCLKMVLDWRQA